MVHAYKDSDTPISRICPGRHFAEMASLITLASVLATLDIDKPNSDTDASSVRKMSGLSNDVMTTGLLSYVLSSL